MKNQPDDDIWELLSRADAAMNEDAPAEKPQKSDGQNVPIDETMFGEDPMIYRNFSNGYGRDFQEEPEIPQPDENTDPEELPEALLHPETNPIPPRDLDETRRISPEEAAEITRRQYAPQNPPQGKLTQAQKAARAAYSGPIRAYNADFVQSSGRPFAPKPAQKPAPEPEISQPVPEAPAEMPPQKKKRKHHWGCLTVLLIPVLLVVLAVGAFRHFISPPRTDDPLGPRKPGTSAVLLCGADVGGLRTDTMMILYVDSISKEAGLLSLPRDTYGQTAYGLDVKLNSAYGRNDCGEEGMKVLLDYVQDILGYRPDGYLLVELPLLSDLVDMMGGVEFDVPTDIHFSDSDMDLDVTLKPGKQHLDGKQALGLVRFRYGYENQDLGRADTQKAFLKACMQQWVTKENLAKLKDVLGLFKANSLNSLDTGNYLWFGLNLLRTGIKNLRTDTLPGYATYIGDQSFYVLYPDEVVDLVNEHYNPYRQKITRDDVHIVTE